MIISGDVRDSQLMRPAGQYTEPGVGQYMEPGVGPV